ncbi:g3817 [Coccomyxa elongata]
MIDASVLNKLAEVVEKVTDKSRLDIDPISLQQLKLLCKASHDNVIEVFDLLLDRLKASDAQTRLHALEVCDMLFGRSRAFRTAAAAQLPALLEAVVGYRPGRPLPGPPELATRLREKALDAVERWNDNYGAFYQQIRLGVRYLKDVLKMKFPELRARAAAAEAERRQREARAQQLLQAKYRRLANNFDAGAAEIQSALDQVQRCFDLLRGDSAPAQPPAQPQSAAPESVMDEEEWEDIDAGKDEVDDGEGLADYGGEAPEELLESAAAYSGMAGLGRAPDPAVLENLHALQRELVNRHLPTLQEWLRIIVKAEVGEAGLEEHARREGLLRAAIELRSRITLAQDRYGVLRSLLPEQTHIILPVDKGKAPAAEPVSNGVAMTELFGTDSDEDAPAGGVPSKPAPTAKSGGASSSAGGPAAATSSRGATIGDRNKAAGRGGAANGALRRASSQHRQRESKLPEDVRRALAAQAPKLPAGANLHYWDSVDEENALVNMRGMELQNHWGPVNANATLPLERISQLFGTVASYYAPPPKAQEKQVAPKQAHPPEPKPAAPNQAPKPARKPPPKTVVGASTMQLLASRVKAGPKLLAGLQELREVGGSAATSAAMRLPPSQAIGSSARAQRRASPDALTAAERLSAAAPDGAPAPAADSSRPGAAAIIGRSPVEAHAHATTETASSNAPDRMDATSRAGRPTHTPAAADPVARTGTPLSRASAGGIPADRGPPAQPHQWPGRPGADATSERPGRAQAAEDRAHNAAVLAEAALSSEALARLLQERELRGGRGAGRSGRTPAKRKLGVRERLSRKLLSGRAAAAAAGELAAVEAASHRERMSNRWEEV